MEIEKRSGAAALELVVTGRLDAYWSDHLGAAIDEALRAGGHQLRIDMGGVQYMSSAGIRVLLRFRKQVHRLGGSFAVVNASEPVRSVLQMVGLEALLADLQAVPPAPAAAARQFACGDVTFDVADVGAGPPGTCRIIGDPASLGAAAAARLTPLRIEPSLVAIGMGVLGDDGTDGAARVGELLAVNGAAAYLPADGTGVPDYMVAAGSLLPQTQVLYAALCDTSAPSLLRFEAPHAERPLGLAALVEACLVFSGAPAAAVVMVAESVGLMGAGLRRSPFVPLRDGGFSFGFPGVREWLSFTPERAYARSVALVAGFVARPAENEVHGELHGMLRRLGSTTDLLGHFHAAAFAYRPVRKGAIELTGTVRALFDDGAPLGILHLLNDDRAIVGGGDSLFARGACWVVPVGTVVRG